MMRSILHPLLCAVLALGLALAGFGQAAAGIAMAQAEARTEVVICGSDGAHVVMVDAFGRMTPKGPAHDCQRCPACALAQAMGTPVQPAMARPATPALLAHASPVNTPDAAKAFGLPVARAPPAKA